MFHSEYAVEHVEQLFACAYFAESSYCVVTRFLGIQLPCFYSKQGQNIYSHQPDKFTICGMFSCCAPSCSLGTFILKLSSMYYT